MVAIGEKDALALDGFQAGPERVALQHAELLERALDAEAAWRYEDQVGVGRGDLLEFDPWRMLPSVAEQISPARNCDQLRHPVAARHWRIDPFDHGHCRTRFCAIGALPDAIDSFPHRSHDL